MTYLDEFKKISFSQTGEDIIVHSIFTILGIERPTFIDIGAYHPFKLSNTALMYTYGSTGINVEPDYDGYKLFTKLRPKDKNLNVGVAKKDGYADFFVMNPPTLSTFDQEEKLRLLKLGHKLLETRKVELLTIDRLISKYNMDCFPDFLTLDTEGKDLEIFQRLPKCNNLPKVICAETIRYEGDKVGRKDNKLIRFITKLGYELYADTKINTIFVEKGLL
jgi:FkbM family methyltransferase